MSDNNNNAKTMYEAVPAAAELNKVPGFDPLKFLRRAGDSMKLDLPYQKLWFRMAHPNGRMRLTAMRITEQMAIFEAKVFLDRSDAEPFSVSVAQQTMQDMRKVCNGLDQQLIVASDHPLIVHTGRLGNHLAGILRTKIPLDGLNIALPLAADDGGQRLRWFDAGVCHARLEGECGAAQIL